MPRGPVPPVLAGIGQRSWSWMAIEDAMERLDREASTHRLIRPWSIHRTSVFSTPSQLATGEAAERAALERMWRERTHATQCLLLLTNLCQRAAMGGAVLWVGLAMRSQARMLRLWQPQTTTTEETRILPRVTRHRRAMQRLEQEIGIVRAQREDDGCPAAAVRTMPQLERLTVVIQGGAALHINTTLDGLIRLLATETAGFLDVCAGEAFDLIEGVCGKRRPLAPDGWLLLPPGCPPLVKHREGLPVVDAEQRHRSAILSSTAAVMRLLETVHNTNAALVSHWHCYWRDLAPTFCLYEQSALEKTFLWAKLMILYTQNLLHFVLTMPPGTGPERHALCRALFRNALNALLLTAT